MSPHLGLFCAYRIALIVISYWHFLFSFFFSVLLNMNIFKQFCLSYKWDPKWYYYSRSKVGLGVIVMKRYSTLFRSPKREPHHRMPLGGYIQVESVWWDRRRGYTNRGPQIQRWAKRTDTKEIRGPKTSLFVGVEGSCFQMMRLMHLKHRWQG